jgi:hypothetical protein
MSNASEDQKLFKLILTAIASENLAADDYRVALDDLKDGRMIKIIEEVLSALASPAKESRAVSKTLAPKKQSAQKHGGQHAKSPDGLFNDIKRRKINRQRLEAIIDSLDRNFLQTIDGSETIRSVVERFRSQSSDRQWQLLDSIVNGNYEVDPYLMNS